MEVTMTIFFVDDQFSGCAGSSGPSQYTILGSSYSLYPSGTLFVTEEAEVPFSMSALAIVTGAVETFNPLLSVLLSGRMLSKDVLGTERLSEKNALSLPSEVEGTIVEASVRTNATLGKKRKQLDSTTIAFTATYRHSLPSLGFGGARKASSIFSREQLFLVCLPSRIMLKRKRNMCIQKSSGVTLLASNC